MDGAIHLDGVIGGLIFIVTAIFVIFAVLTNLAVYVANRKSEDAGSKWARFFLWSGSILLLFDGVCFLLFVQNGPVAFSREEGNAFDYRMLTIWIPFHIAAYFLIAFGLQFIYLHKERISGFIDRLR